MSDALWAADTPNQSVASFSEILTVYLIPGAGERQLWQLDEQIVLGKQQFRTSHSWVHTQIVSLQKMRLHRPRYVLNRAWRLRTSSG